MTHRMSDPVDRPRLERLGQALGWSLALILILALVAWAPSVVGADDGDPPAEIEVPDGPQPGQATMGGHAYRSYCASCHGAEAKGHGSIATMLSVRPADLTKIAERNGGDFPYERVYRIIDGRLKVKGHGTSDMPAWGDAFQEITESEAEVEERIHQLVQFLWTIQE